MIDEPPRTRALIASVAATLVLGACILVVAGTGDATQTADYCQMHKCYNNNGSFTHCHGHPNSGYNYYCHQHYYSY